MIVSRLGLIPRQVLLQAVRRSHDDPAHHTQWKGKNLFFSIDNHRTLALKFCFFFGIPFWMPFLLLRFQLNKG